MYIFVFYIVFSLFLVPGLSIKNASVSSDANEALGASLKKVEKHYAYYGIMLARRTDHGEVSIDKLCTSFYPELSDMAHNESSAKYFPALDIYDWHPCLNSSPPVLIAGYVILLDGSDVAYPANASCSLLHAAAIAQENSTDFMEVAVYSPPEDFAFNYSLLVVWLLAVCTVASGAFWSGKTRLSLHQEQHVFVYSSSPDGDDPRHSTSDQSNGELPRDVGEYSPSEADEELGVRRGSKAPVYVKESAYLDISPRVALLFVLLMCLMLVSLYFLYEYLVYMIIGLFCIASISAVYSCLEPLVIKIPCATCRTPYFNAHVIRGQLEVRHILLLLFSIAVAVTWVVLRNEPYAWVLQDILGVAFCINMLRVVRLPNLKICTVLLSSLFIYDIFFVFITPLFTPDGNSIMVEVAQGSGEGAEQLPMVFKVPHITYNEVVSVCRLDGNYNLLGFGDVLVPGLLVAFLFFYDLKVAEGTAKCPVYYVLSIVDYGLGLCLTFAGLYLMKGAQPALLYLVPATLLPTVIVAAIRGHLADMWRMQSVSTLEPQCHHEGGAGEVGSGDEERRGSNGADDDQVVTEGSAPRNS